MAAYVKTVCCHWLEMEIERAGRSIRTVSFQMAGICYSLQILSFMLPSLTMLANTPKSFYTSCHGSSGFCDGGNATAEASLNYP